MITKIIKTEPYKSYTAVSHVTMTGIGYVSESKIVDVIEPSINPDR